MAGTFATVGFAGLAAVTYNGTASVVDDQAVAPDVSSDSVAGTTGQQGTTTGDSTPQATSAPSTTTQSNPSQSTRRFTAVQPPTRSSSRAHSSTGGS